MLVDVAALPVPVRPLGQDRRKAGEPAVAAQARGRGGVGEQVQPQGAGRRPAGDRDACVQVEVGARTVGVQPHCPAGAGDQPGGGRVVALGDAADLEQVLRAIRPRVAAIGSEVGRAARLVEVEPVPGTEPDEPFVGAALPGRGHAQRSAMRRQLDGHPLLAEANRQLHRPGAVGGAREQKLGRSGAHHGQRRHVLTWLELLRHDDALGDPDQAVDRGALGRPQAQILDHAVVVAPHRQPEWPRRDLQAHVPQREGECGRCIDVELHDHGSWQSARRPGVSVW